MNLEAAGTPTGLTHAVGTRCATLCDDIPVDADGGYDLSNACDLCRAWLESDRPLEASVHASSGHALSLDAGLEEAGRLIASAVAPMVVSSPNISLEAALEVVRLARALRAPLLDPTAPLRPSGRRLVDFSANFGELRSSADAIVFWNVSPRQIAPRFLDRLADKASHLHLVGDEGLLRDDALAGRKAETWTIEPRSDLEFISAVGRALTGESAGDDEASRLASALRPARHVHFCVGDLALHAYDEAEFHAALGRLAAEVRHDVRVTTSRLSASRRTASLETAALLLEATPPPFLFASDEDSKPSVRALSPRLAREFLDDAAASDLVISVGDVTVDSIR
ncbi:MAG: hypothetical protein AAF517_17940, partial [Planctomycetota bacterium]